MESIWTQSCHLGERGWLEGDLETEVAVIGAGMAGILTAWQLQKAGHQVVVLEANRIGSGQTRNTTAKITAQHGLIYQRLTRELGADKAGQYAMANQHAVSAFRELIEAQGIDCDFEEKDAYVYGDDLELLRGEAEAAAGLGLPASFSTDFALPVPAAGAVRFSRQAQFNPLKFLKALSEQVNVFEHTPVMRAEGNMLVTDRAVVRAEKVVFACHYPFVNFPGLYFARMHQERSYVLALEGCAPIDGMFIGAGEEGVSLRGYRSLLLFGGEGHRTGENPEGGRYDALRRRAREWFPDSREVCCWSAQDCITPDAVPYIGRYAPGKPDWYVATGFQKWGMTSSMVSALVLGELLSGRESPYAPVFDPGRFDLSEVPGVAGESGQAVKGLTKRLLQIPMETARGIPAGHGGVVWLEGKKVGVYKDERGEVHAVDVRCPHLGCQLEWNPDERSWDCPCHGSRFDYTGRLISGPAQENISHE